MDGKKISLPATLLIMLYVGILDLVGILIFFLGLDDFLILDALTFPVTQFYFRIKGVRAMTDLAASIIELIPYVGALPIKSIGVALTIYLANRQETAPSAVGETA